MMRNIDLARSGATEHDVQLLSALVMRLLEADGWVRVASKGSHHQFKHSTKPGRVTIPHPRVDVPIGTLRSIEKQGGLSLRET